MQTFSNTKEDRYKTSEKDAFTFRSDEFEKLLEFLRRIEFIDLSNEEKFQIEDISISAGPKIITDATDRAIINRIKQLNRNERLENIFRSLHHELTPSEINLLLGRKQALELFQTQLSLKAWAEADWQDFFESQSWVFGYGLDYRIMRLFDREMVVGTGGTDNRNKPTSDFLMNFTDYSVLVEIKLPETRIFQTRRGGRSGTWRFSADFIDAVSQVLEQKAEWLSASSNAEHYDKSGERLLKARTRDVKAILVIGNKGEFSETQNVRDEILRAILSNFSEGTLEILKSLHLMSYWTAQHSSRETRSSGAKRTSKAKYKQ